MRLNSLWQPVACNSSSLSPTEQRYAQTGKETLAIVHAFHMFDQLLFGKADVLICTIIEIHWNILLPSRFACWPSKQQALTCFSNCMQYKSCVVVKSCTDLSSAYGLSDSTKSTVAIGSYRLDRIPVYCYVLPFCIWLLTKLYANNASS